MKYSSSGSNDNVNDKLKSNFNFYQQSYHINTFITIITQL